MLRIGVDKSLAGDERVAEAPKAMVTIGLPVIAEDLEVEVATPEAFPSFLEFEAIEPTPSRPSPPTPSRDPSTSSTGHSSAPS